MDTKRIERKALLVDLAVSAKGLTREEWKTLGDWEKIQLQAGREQIKNLTPEDWKEINKHRKNPKILSPIEQKQRDEMRELRARNRQDVNKTREREGKAAKGKIYEERQKEREKLVKPRGKEKKKGMERERHRGRYVGED